MYNKVILVSRIATDIELKTTPSGVSVCQFRVAVDRTYTSGGERKTDFLNVVAWRQTAVFVSRFFGKGKMIGIDGTIQTREYTDNNGNKRTITEILAEKVFFIEPKPKDENNGNTEPEFNVQTAEEDLPF